MIGFYWVSKEDALKEYNRKKMSKKLEDKIRRILKAEIETMDQYLTGMVYGYEVEDEDGDVIDSCWGYYGESKYCLEEGFEVAIYHIKKDQERADQMQMRMAIAIAHGELV